MLAAIKDMRTGTVTNVERLAILRNGILVSNAVLRNQKTLLLQSRNTIGTALHVERLEFLVLDRRALNAARKSQRMRPQVLGKSEKRVSGHRIGIVPNAVQLAALVVNQLALNAAHQTQTASGKSKSGGSAIGTAQRAARLASLEAKRIASNAEQKDLRRRVRKK